MKRTLIIGASVNPSRYSYLAAQKLLAHGHPIYLLGRRKGNLFGQEIEVDKIALKEIDTVTLYINSSHQIDYYDYIITLNPKRVIFNPGTENSDFENILRLKKIVPVRACTLVLLSIGQY
jgi:predicted CoA-binding protein